jgi:hypothetical protein
MNQKMCDIDNQIRELRLGIHPNQRLLSKHLCEFEQHARELRLGIHPSPPSRPNLVRLPSPVNLASLLTTSNFENSMSSAKSYNVGGSSSEDKPYPNYYYYSRGTRNRFKKSTSDDHPNNVGGSSSEDKPYNVGGSSSEDKPYNVGGSSSEGELKILESFEMFVEKYNTYIINVDPRKGYLIIDYNNVDDHFKFIKSLFKTIIDENKDKIENNSELFNEFSQLNYDNSIDVCEFVTKLLE